MEWELGKPEEIERIDNPNGLPCVRVSKGKNFLIVDIVLALGFAKTRGEAKRLIKQGAVRIG